MKFLVASILVSVVTFLLEIRMTFSCGRYCTYTDIHLGKMKRNDILDNCDHFQVMKITANALDAILERDLV